MDDRLGEVLDGGDVRLYVQWVQVAAQPVQEGLAGEGLLLERDVRIPGWSVGDLGGAPIALEPEPSQSLYGQGILRVDHELFLTVVERESFDSVGHQSNLPFIGGV